MSGVRSGNKPEITHSVPEDALSWRFSRFDWLALCLVAAGLFLRVWRLDLTRYIYDHAYPTAQAIEILCAGHLPLTSLKTSVLFENPPLMSYLQLVPLVVAGRRNAPLAVQTFTVFLNCLALPLVYTLGKRWYGRWPALIALSLFAFNPWAILFSRATWVQGLHPFYSTLVFYFLHVGLWSEGSERKRGLFLCLISFAAMSQTYLLTYVTLLPLVVILLLFRKRVSWQTVLIGAVAFLLISAPYFVNILSHIEEVLKSTRNFTSSAVRADDVALSHALRLVSGRDYANLYGVGYASLYPALCLGTRIVSVAVEVAISVGILRAGYWAVKRRPGWRMDIISLLWFTLPIAAMTVHMQLIHPHYLFLTYPAGFLLAARGIEPLLDRSWLRRGAYAFSLSLVLLWGVTMSAQYQAVIRDPNQGKIEGLAVRYGMVVGQHLRETTALLGTDEVNSHAASALLTALTGELLTSKRHFDSNLVIASSEHPTLYLLLDHEIPPMVWAIGQELMDQRVPFDGDGAAVFFLLPARPAEDIMARTQHPLDVCLDNGLVLLGYDLSSPVKAGEALQVTSYWAVEKLEPDRFRPWSVFNHLVTASDAKVAQADGWGVSPHDWHQGDIFIATYTLPIPLDVEVPESRARLMIGMYDIETMTRVQMTGRDGTVSGDHVATVEVQIN